MEPVTLPYEPVSPSHRVRRSASASNRWDLCHLGQIATPGPLHDARGWGRTEPVHDCRPTKRRVSRVRSQGAVYNLVYILARSTRMLERQLRKPRLKKAFDEE